MVVQHFNLINDNFTRKERDVMCAINYVPLHKNKNKRETMKLNTSVRLF